MPGVGFDDDGTQAPRAAQHPQRDTEVDHRGRGRDRRAQRHVADGLRMGEALGGLDQNERCGHADEQALDAAGEILRLGMTVRMVCVGRRLGDAHNEQGECGGGDVDDGLHRVRQKAYRARDLPGQQLEADDDDGGEQRGAEIGSGLHAVIVHGLRE